MSIRNSPAQFSCRVLLRLRIGSSVGACNRIRALSKQQQFKRLKIVPPLLFTALLIVILQNGRDRNQFISIPSLLSLIAIKYSPILVTTSRSKHWLKSGVLLGLIPNTSGQK